MRDPLTAREVVVLYVLTAAALVWFVGLVYFVAWMFT